MDAAAPATNARPVYMRRKRALHFTCRADAHRASTIPKRVCPTDSPRRIHVGRLKEDDLFLIFFVSPFETGGRGDIFRILVAAAGKHFRRVVPRSERDARAGFIPGTERYSLCSRPSVGPAILCCVVRQISLLRRFGKVCPVESPARKCY